MPDEEPDPDETDDKDMELSDEVNLSSLEYNPTTWAAITKGPDGRLNLLDDHKPLDKPTEVLREADILRKLAAASNAEEMKIIANGLPVAHITLKIINEFLSQFGGMIACPHWNASKTPILGCFTKILQHLLQHRLQHWTLPKPQQNTYCHYHA
ncbi:hypothetical protein BC829DRAFT_415714 [Chytridium lagenaria]|nr:hypothetical protein BC829DRAFT_415714 [Chytridium lagenaria]